MITKGSPRKMTLSIRSTVPEEMDDEGVAVGCYQRCLAELDSINRLTFTDILADLSLAPATVVHDYMHESAPDSAGSP